MSYRHSKIVCTIGPSSRTPRLIDKLLRAGMDVAVVSAARRPALTAAECAQVDQVIAVGLVDGGGHVIGEGPQGGGSGRLVAKVVAGTVEGLGLCFVDQLPEGDGRPSRVIGICQAQIFQGASSEFQSRLSSSLSRGVSIGCQKPACS